MSDLESWEVEHGRIPDGAVVLVHTGRGRHYRDREEYLGYPKDRADR